MRSRGWERFQAHARKSLYCIEVTVGRNMDINDAPGEVSKRKEEHVIRNWRKGEPYYKVAKNLAEFCSSVLWKVEPVSNEIRYLAEEIFTQSGECEAQLLIVKCKRRERNQQNR